MTAHPLAAGFAKLQSDVAQRVEARRPSLVAKEAAREFEALEAGQDGHEPWSDAYRRRVEQIVDEAIAIYGKYLPIAKPEGRS